MGLQELSSCSSFPKDFDYKIIVTIVSCFMPIKVLNMVESNLYSNIAGVRIIPVLRLRKLRLNEIKFYAKGYTAAIRFIWPQWLVLLTIRQY